MPETVPTSLGVSEKRSTETKFFSLEICQCWCSFRLRPAWT
ncbi:unnamed protein product [Brassica rapa subsp. trilocularis]